MHVHHVNSHAMTQISWAHIKCIEYVGSSLGPIYNQSNYLFIKIYLKRVVTVVETV